MPLRPHIAIVAAALGCGGSASPNLEPTTKASPTTSAAPTTSTPTVPSSRAWPCSCPEDYDAADFNSWQQGEHVVGRPLHVEPRPQLAIVLHGQGQSPSHHDQLMRTVNHAGFQLIGVNYPSIPDIEWCQDNLLYSEWGWCSEEMRRARVYGAEYALTSQVSDVESIVAKALGILQQAHAEDPEGEWDRFYDVPPAGPITDHESYIHWDQVLLAGFSQGGSNAAMIARDHRVFGVFMISGPSDPLVSWLDDAGETPGCARFGVRHDRETMVDYLDVNYGNIGLPGLVASMDALDVARCDELTWPPYGGSQWLSSALEAGDSCTSGNPPHGAMANDVCLNTLEAPTGDPYTLFRPYLGALCLLGEGNTCD